MGLMLSVFFYRLLEFHNYTYFSIVYLFQLCLLFSISIAGKFEQLQAELGRPSALHPDKGKVSIYVDCSPTAAPTFEVNTSVICYVLIFTFI
jgi:hypothetical protein